LLLLLLPLFTDRGLDPEENVVRQEQVCGLVRPRLAQSGVRVGSGNIDDQCHMSKRELSFEESYGVSYRVPSAPRGACSPRSEDVTICPAG
jgi:hypothetical protein